MTFQECIYPGCDLCGIDEWGLCGAHHWSVTAEIVEGMFQLERYLAHWAAYQEWCVEHQVAA